jgi:hypothetical protein
LLIDISRQWLVPGRLFSVWNQSTTGLSTVAENHFTLNGTSPSKCRETSQADGFFSMAANGVEAYMAFELATAIEGGIPILGGLYATALGHGVVRVSRSLPSALMQKTLKWLGPAVVLFGIFTGWQAHLHAGHPPAEEIVRQINNRLTFPIKVDETTRATGIQGKGDDITYDYSVAAPLSGLGGRDEVQRRLEQQWLSTACKSKDFQTFFRGGYTLHMRYSFEGAPEAILVSIPPRACGY